MKLYYYQSSLGNFGDDLNEWLWEELTPGIWTESGTVRVSGIGTIIGDNMPVSTQWVVMSSGTGYASVPDSFCAPNWNVICVRGPLTAKVLDLPPEKAGTDGAILISLLPQYQPVPETERHGVVFMPHHAKTLRLGRWKEVCEKVGVEFLDPRQDSKLLLDRIRHAKLVLAEAMHAAIVADTVRVPWIPLAISAETNSFKWLDWALSMEVPYKPVTLPASSSLEYLYSRLMSLLMLDHRFTDLSLEGALEHYHRIRQSKESFSAEFERRIIGKTFGILKMIASLPVISTIYKIIDTRRFDRAVESFRVVVRQPSFLSREEVFSRKKTEMQLHLETLKSQGENVAREEAESEKPAPVNANKRTSVTAAPWINGHALNTLLRLGSLGAKLVFTLYMGRYLGLDEMGTYGLIAAYVAILVTLLGMRFDYVVSRDIVDASPFEIARKIRDQSVFYAINYLILGLALVAATAGPLRNFSTQIVVFSFVLSVLESFAAITSGNFVSLKKPIFANVLFFIRAALWTFPVIVLGIFFPAYRTAETIFYWWAGGAALSIVVTFFAWRDLPWMNVLQTPVDWEWIKAGVRKCLLIWLGVIGATGSAYMDRFVVEHYLGLKYVGIVSFYSSFIMAIQSLLQSGVFAFSYPRLISHYRAGDTMLFQREVRRMTLHAMMFAGVMVIGVGVAVPLLGTLFHRPEFSTYAPTLWLMLLAVWLRSSTEGLYYVLYARHQDRIIWIGGLLALIPAFAGNMLLVPLSGFQGIGYSAILVAVFLCLWRFYSIKRFEPDDPAVLHSAEATGSA